MSDDARDVAAALAGAQAASGSAARSSADAAFARLYDRHAPLVRAVCLTELRDPGAADDALQETFVRASRKLADVRDAEGGGLRNWICTIARHVCSEQRRARGRRDVHERAAGAARAEQRSINEHRSPGGEHAEQLRALTEALGALPEQQRTALHLYYLERDPAQAAAEMLGVSRSAFYRLLEAARDALALRLKPAVAHRAEGRA